VYVTGPVEAAVAEGVPTVSFGNVLATEKVVLGPAAALLPLELFAVPEAMLIPRVPVPLIEDIVTVRELVPLPVTVTFPLAVPVLLRVILLAAKVTLLALV